MNAAAEMERLKHLVELTLVQILAVQYPEKLYEAMIYSVFAGGKRLRPTLLIGACKAGGGEERIAMPFACAIEMIHTYSLIHDDLPALDNDDLRRGRPSCHKEFGEAMAILAGDALLNTAYEVMARAALSAADKKSIAAMSAIADAAGAKGMIGGQTADILSEDENKTEETLLYIHGNKTAALIHAAITAGAILGECPPASMAVMNEAGIKLGMAFQIKDDLLNVTSDSETLGKPVGNDAKNNKFTYVSLYGLEKAQNDYETLSQSAIDVLSKLPDPFLSEYAKEIFKREN